MSLNATKMRLPLTLDEVTPEWLTEAMGTRFPGVRVASATRDRERAGTSTSARFNLTYDRDGGHADLPPAIYVKGGFDAVMRRRVWAALIQEARFYADFAPDVPVNIPVAYFAGVDEEQRQGIVILEDMSARGVRFGVASDPSDIDKVAAIIEGQAKLHARFWGDKRLPDYAFWVDPAKAFCSYAFRPSNWDLVSERSYGPMMLEVMPTRERALELMDRLWAIDEGRTQTLLHGDCHVGNLFYEADGRPGFLDWQCTFPGDPGFDQAETLLSALSIEDRRKSEIDLLKMYREVLVASGVQDAPSFDDIFLSYRQHMMRMMPFWVMNPYDMQSEETTITISERSLQAAIDHDMVGSLAA